MLGFEFLHTHMAATTDVYDAANGAAFPIAAMGVIASLRRPLSAQPASSHARHRTGRIAWVHVITPSFSAAQRARSNATFMAPCSDGWKGLFSMKKRTSCVCKTVHWYRAALSLFPTATFIGKVEDDALVSERLLLRDLRWASNLPGARELQWYGKFDWAVISTGVATDATSDIGGGGGRRLDNGSSRSDGGPIMRVAKGRFCGSGDNLVTRAKPPLTQCGDGWDRPVVAPFAEGGLDLRSRALAELMTACPLAWEAAGRDRIPGGATAGLGACDGVQGYLLAQCTNRSIELFQ